MRGWEWWAEGHALTFPLLLLRRTGRAHLQLDVCGWFHCEHQISAMQPMLFSSQDLLLCEICSFLWKGVLLCTWSGSPASLVCSACALLATYMLQPALLLSMVEDPSLFSLTSRGAASWFNCFSLRSCKSPVPLLNCRDQSWLQGAVVDVLVLNRAASVGLSWFYHWWRFFFCCTLTWSFCTTVSSVWDIFIECINASLN